MAKCRLEAETALYVMGWLQLDNTGDHEVILFRLDSISSGLSYSITDLIDVWTESLTFDKVAERAKQLNSMLVFDTTQDTKEFIDRLRESLKSPASFELGHVEYSVKLMSHSFKWFFRPSRCPIEESRTQIRSYTVNVLSGLLAMTRRLQESQQLSGQLGYHLQNLARMTHEPYVPRRYQQVYSEYTDALDSTSSAYSLGSASQQGPPSSPPSESRMAPSWGQGADILSDMDYLPSIKSDPDTTLTFAEHKEEEVRREKLDKVVEAQLRRKKRRF